MINLNVIFLRKKLLNNQLIINNITFRLTDIYSIYSYKINLVEINYIIEVFDYHNNPILPSDLALYYNLHIICSSLVNNKININSLPKIENDKYFKCVEFYHLKERKRFGIIIYETKNDTIINKNYSIYNFGNNQFNYTYQNDDVFNSTIIYKNFEFLYSKIKDNKTSFESKKLKKLYVSKPTFILKRNYNQNGQWYFSNIYNEYFCFCKGLNCLNQTAIKRCKYFYYIYLIDINRNVYKKTDFLLMDFIFKNYSSDDVYPIYEKMINKNLNAHYLTENGELYDRYCHNVHQCDLIILANEKSYRINDEFLEKHFSLILKLKQVLSSVGVGINYINNLFYNIDYITYICIGHGISFFKPYLYDDYYGSINFDKLLIPNSEKLISVAIKHGWEEKNLIKFNLPRWEKYNHLDNFIVNNKNITSNSIFIMFTWREIKKNGRMSFYYFKNIINLLNNELLINYLLEYKITLYFSIHHQVLKYKNEFETINNLNHIKFIKESDIAECLSKTSLVVTDYSSIIFDMIYRRKPYIIFIPDIYDSFIEQNYLNKSYDVINKFRTNKFEFENVYFDLNSTVDKINYYIKNDFRLNRKLKKFYNDFHFKKGAIINKFINYINNKLSKN